MCNRNRQRMEVSLCGRHVRRRYLRPFLSVFPDCHGRSGYDHGICRRPGQQEKHCQKFSGTGKTRAQMASERLSWHDRQLSSDDVLHHGNRMDALLLLSDAHR